MNTNYHKKFMIFYAQFRNKPNIEQVQADIESHNVKNYVIKDAQQNHTNVPLYTDRLSITVLYEIQIVT